MAKRVLLGKEGSNYVLKVSKPGVDVIDDTINSQDYLFNSEVYRAGVIRSSVEHSAITTSGVDLPTTSDANNTPYIPAYIVSEKGALYPQGKFFEQYGSGGTSGGTRKATLVNCLNTAAGGGMFQFSLNSSGTARNKLIPFFVDVDGMTDPRPGQGDGTYPFFAARSRASSDGPVKIQILGIPCQFGKMINDATLFGTSLLSGQDSGGSGGGGGGGTVSAPTISGTSRTARNNTNDTVAVSAANGTNNSGTITYAQGSSNSASGLTFGSSNSFNNHPRGTTRYYFAKQSNLVSDTAGSNHIHSSAAVDITPSGFGNLTASAASGSAGSATYQIAGLGTGDTASASASGNGSANPSSGQNGTTITFSLNATGSGGNTTSCNITVGTQTITNGLTVTTATDNTPTFNPSDFTDATSNIQPGATVDSNAITVGGINVGISVSVSGCTVSIAGGSEVTSGTVTSGQTVRIRSTASGSFNTQTTPSINVGGTTINQIVRTRVAVTASQPNAPTITQTNSNASSQTVSLSATGGSGTLQFSNDNSNWGSGNTFSQNRNSTVTYYARRTAEAGASSPSSAAYFIPPVYNLGTYPDVGTVSSGGSGLSRSADSTGFASYINFSQNASTYGSYSLSVSTSSNPGSMLSNLSVNTTGTVSGTIASNSGSARTATVTVSVSTSKGGSDTDTFSVPQAAAASNLWEVGIAMGGSASGSGYSGFFAFHGTTTDTSCDLFTGTPAWRFYDLPQSSTNTFFWANGLHSNGGWTTLKIYNGTSASASLLATVARTSCTYSQPFFTGSTVWTLPADYTATSGNRYLVFT